MSWLLYGMHLILLILTLVAGVGGTHTVSRWLDLGFFKYQPSETLKFILVLVVAGLLSRRKFKRSLSLNELIKYGLIILLPVSLVLIQPDLGTAGLSLLIAGSLILFNGIQKRVFIVTMAAFSSLSPSCMELFIGTLSKKSRYKFYPTQKRFSGNRL